MTAALTSDDLPHLLAPLGLDDFRAEHWERRPLYLPGHPDKVARWACDRDAFFDLLEARPEPDIKAQFHDGRGIHRELDVQPHLARALWDAGLTICAQNLDRSDPRLGRLAASTRRSLGHAGSVIVNAYASPAGCGFGLHFDSQSVFIIQLEGVKHWRYSHRPALPAPPENLIGNAGALARYRQAHPWSGITLPPDESLAEQTLHPGDVLYLPAGTWHRARAEGESLALTLTPLPFSAEDLLIDLLRKQLRGDPDWRRYLPLQPAQAWPAVGLPPVVESFLADRLTDLRRHVTALTPAQIGIAWRTELAVDARAPTASPATPSEPDLTAADQLRVAQPAGLLEDEEQQTVALFAGDTVTELPVQLAADLRPFLHHLVERQEFLAGNAVHFCAPGEELDWDDVRHTLTLLVKVGALSVAPG
jgi:ribosomal protein L16 Arg81 hydroxylase